MRTIPLVLALACVSPAQKYFEILNGDFERGLQLWRPGGYLHRHGLERRGANQVYTATLQWGKGISTLEYLGSPFTRSDHRVYFTFSHEGACNVDVLVDNFLVQTFRLTGSNTTRLMTRWARLLSNSRLTFRFSTVSTQGDNKVWIDDVAVLEACNRLCLYARPALTISGGGALDPGSDYEITASTVPHRVCTIWLGLEPHSQGQRFPGFAGRWFLGSHLLIPLGLGFADSKGAMLARFRAPTDARWLGRPIYFQAIEARTDFWAGAFGCLLECGFRR